MPASAKGPRAAELTPCVSFFSLISFFYYLFIFLVLFFFLIIWAEGPQRLELLCIRCEPSRHCSSGQPYA